METKAKRHNSKKKNFSAIELPKYSYNGKIVSNQYNPITADQSYSHLISRTKEIKYGCFTCWEPSGIGFDLTKSGYMRFSFQGKKLLCHRFVWKYHHNNEEPKGDISHKCGNKLCCRLSHLEDEPRKIQRIRDTCPGWIQTGSIWLKVCSHNPHCMKGTVFANYSSSHNPDE